jgi:error-prone DNA polymerase
MTEPEQLAADLWTTGISRELYPTALIRDRLDALGVEPAGRLAELDDRTRVLVGGIVTHRQRPPSAGGVTFISLEDETGLINIIVPQNVFARYRRVARDTGALLIHGMLEKAHDVTNILAERIDKLPLRAGTVSRNFR